jgi:hypothetical protein
MSVWLTYSLADFLLFSPQTYFRLLELYNRAIWPLQVVAVGLGLAILWLLQRPSIGRGRAIAAIVGVCWLWVAWAYLQRHYATINWAASYAAAAFTLEGLALLAVATSGRPLFQVSADAAGLIGLGLLLLALVLLPLLGPLLGRPWSQVELFGTAPDPTAVATLGLVLLAARRRDLLLLVVPLLWCALSAATLWAMEAAETWAMIAAAALAIGGAASRLGRRR